MKIQDTQYLSQLSPEELKAIFRQWPSPNIIFMFVAAIIGANVSMVKNIEAKSMSWLIGSLSFLLILVFSLLIYAFSKKARAKKLIKQYSEARSLHLH